jgi:hypothetical protein
MSLWGMRAVIHRPYRRAARPQVLKHAPGQFEIICCAEKTPPNPRLIGDDDQLVAQPC